MTNPHDMTDEQLCMAISLKREPKPETPPKKFSDCLDNKSWRWSPFEQDKGWRPINWLSWENAGRLLEEMAENGYCPALIFDDDSHWAVSCDGTQSLNLEEGPCDVSTSFWIKKDEWCDRPTRSICEAWLMVNE